MEKVLQSILTKNAIATDDKDYFVVNPYYRSVDGELSSTFEDLQKLWTRKRTNVGFTWIESNKHMKYYRLTMEDGHTLLGKVFFKDNKISYLYETLFVENKKRYFCEISYDGTLFEGYQKQVDKRTVQGEIERALKAIFKEKIRVHASGRTDKGVHAYQQTLHFDLDTKIPLKRMRMIMNQYFPEDIYCRQIVEKPQVFHARYDTVYKTYMYHLDFGEFDVMKRNYRWYVKTFDLARFHESLNSVVGEHDFASFTKTTEKDTCRTIFGVDIEVEDKQVKVFISGDGFLRYMVRNIIMAAYLIASKEVNYTMEELLLAKDNTILRQMAEPTGLYLYEVGYE